MSLEAVKRRVLERDEWTCQYCGTTQDELSDSLFGRQTMHVDHVFPHSKGGPDEEWNLVAACPRCNLSKSAKVLPLNDCPVPYRLLRLGYQPSMRRVWDVCRRYPTVLFALEAAIDAFEYERTEVKAWSTWTKLKRELRVLGEGTDDYEFATHELGWWFDVADEGIEWAA